jgi:DNA-directed RNA polymerase beta' subunit
MEDKRYLLPEEIHLITSSVLREIKVIHKLPVNLSLDIISKIQNKLETQLRTIKIYPKGIKTLIEKLIVKYRLIMPGKSVGIICGQSIGEMQTQTTLNTFHSAGLTNKVVVQGVPRFLEIIDTNRSETQGTPSCYIYLKTGPKPHKSFRISEIRNIIGNSLICFYFHNFIQTREVSEIKNIDWYGEEEKINFKGFEHCLAYKLDLSILYRYKITLDFIATQLEKVIYQYLKVSQVKIITSPLYIGEIHILINDINDIEEKIHHNIINTKICGIDKIQNIFFTRDVNNLKDTWYIETDGSNLEEILNLPFVDSWKTYSNDIWEIYNLFGIEAVYAYIFEELENLMPTIHKSHLSLLADRMTISGKLCSITRYTRKNENTSVFSKTTFEETLSGFLSSAIHKERDNINGVSASIICGRVPQIGSGMNEIRLLR